MIKTFQTIEKLYSDLIEIQKIKTPNAVRGIEVSSQKWVKTLNKIALNKKLTKSELILVKTSENKINELKRYIDSVNKL